MAKAAHPSLTRRERQIMDVLYRLGRATAADVMEALAAAGPDAAHRRRQGATGARAPWKPNSSTVRTQLRVLEAKGHVRHEAHGLRFVFMPAVPRHAARRSALRHLMDTFFDGSAEKVVAAVLGGEAARVSDDELQRIADLVAKAAKESR
jgi:predicted transcriptional regulator